MSSFQVAFKLVDQASCFFADCSVMVKVSTAWADAFVSIAFYTVMAATAA
jgi:hypothetical protein